MSNSEEWLREELARELRDRPRVLVLFYAAWCPYSRAFLPLFEQAEPGSNVPFARVDLGHPMDPRWDEHAIGVIPTLVYFEHGEELERLDGARGRGISRRELEEFLAEVDAIQEEAFLPKRMHGPRRS